MRYTNPILYGDYSDPDVVRVGEDFYMISSSFTYIPGLPVLHSKDLVHWELIGYAARRLPFARYDKPAHKSGIWAPSLRYHNGTFYIYVCMPDEGLFAFTTKDPAGEWECHYVKDVTGWIDPCPLFDDDGRAWLVHGFAASRAGINNVLYVHKLSPDGLTVLDKGKMVYDGADHNDITVEGPKAYKRDGVYWILCPAGSVRPGYQLALRAENIYGPYERRVVLSQGNTPINGPHQGGWVNDGHGMDWFIHFQDMDAYGRVTHLQPVDWSDGWPVMGNGGEPCLSYGATPNATSTEALLDWVSDGTVYDFCGRRRVYSGGSLVTKFPSPSFTARVRICVTSKTDGAVDGILLAGDRDVRFGLVLESRDRRFALLLKDGEETTRLGTILAREIDAGALKAWTSGDVEMEVRVRPCDNDARQCEVVLSCRGLESSPVRLANSIWQGVKIGVAAETVDSSPRNWIDLGVKGQLFKWDMSAQW